ncbi:hypothetical protein ABEP50_15860 [Priestia megaterium]
MPHPQTRIERLDDFYSYLMNHKGYKMHEIDEMDIHHMFRLVRKEMEENKQIKKEEEQPKKVYIDQIAGW